MCCDICAVYVLLLHDYIYFESGYSDIFCVNRIGVNENVEQIWQCNPCITSFDLYF